MEDSSMFMQWAMDTLLNEHPEPAIIGDGEATFPSLQALRDASHAVEMVRELMADDEAHAAANSWSSGDGDITDGGSGTVPAPAAVRDSHGSFRRAPPPSSNTNLPLVSWNFVTGSAQPGSGGTVEEAATPRSLFPEPATGHRRRPRASLRSLGAASSASYAPDHIIAERKRREKINRRLIELSTVIPGLKKMDKATILSDAAKYVKELQQRLKALEEEAAAGSNARSNETVVRVKKPCNAAAAAAPDENGSPSSTSASSGPPATGKPALPEIQARFSEKSAMVRIHCGSGKGVAVTVLGEVEDLGLSIVHANVMPFSACTVIITITAKAIFVKKNLLNQLDGSTQVEEGFTVTAEEIVDRLSSALSHQHSNCNGTQEID
ncbi:transcription factor bHLH18-like [Panicum miliaceum]|uniref:Transcription factor bHLH18-like n=1 Tax=Panicum miliaceum TaxID=4540 RepID=A0A3L6SVG8_PANMI|nr:transcription factor bHLH18-like [Panicum miliaceum]